MKITVEISLYPFKENYAPPINDFIGRLKNTMNLKPSLMPQAHSSPASMQKSLKSSQKKQPPHSIPAKMSLL